MVEGARKLAGVAESGTVVTGGPDEPEVVAFGLEGGEIHVRAPDSTVGSEIASLFPDYRTEEPDTVACRDRIEVEVGEGGYRIRRPGRGISRPGSFGAGVASGDRSLGGPPRIAADLVEMLTISEGIVARGLLEAASHRVHLHAAGARVGDGAVLALGTRGAGKSSLALAWSVLGLPVLGDDVVFVDDDGRARPFRRLFKVDPGRLESHGIDPDSTPAWVEGSEEAWFDPRMAGGWSDGPVPVRAVVVLERGEGFTGSARLTPLGAAEALNDLLASVVWTGRSGEASLDPLLRLLDGCKAYRLSFASSARAAREVIELMKG